MIFVFLRGFNLLLINKIGDLTEEKIESFKQSCVQMVLKRIVGLEMPKAHIFSVLAVIGCLVLFLFLRRLKGNPKT